LALSDSLQTLPRVHALTTVSRTLPAEFPKGETSLKTTPESNQQPNEVATHWRRRAQQGRLNKKSERLYPTHLARPSSAFCLPSSASPRTQRTYKKNTNKTAPETTQQQNSTSKGAATKHKEPNEPTNEKQDRRTTQKENDKRAELKTTSRRTKQSTE